MDLDRIKSRLEMQNLLKAKSCPSGKKDNPGHNNPGNEKPASNDERPGLFDKKKDDEKKKKKNGNGAEEEKEVKKSLVDQLEDTASSLEELSKAGPTKYIKREKKGGKWVYTYKEGKGKQVAPGSRGPVKASQWENEIIKLNMKGIKGDEADRIVYEKFKKQGYDVSKTKLGLKEKEKAGGAGKKFMNVQYNVGRKGNYIVNFHDGKKTHPDGSPFFDMRIFRNKKEFEKFQKQLKAEGYETGGASEAMRAQAKK